MVRSTAVAVAIVIVGVLLIVIGAGMVISGNNEIQAAQEWEDLPPQQRGCVDTLFGGWECPENPFDIDAARGRFWTGLGVTIIGGIALYFGTR